MSTQDVRYRLSVDGRQAVSEQDKVKKGFSDIQTGADKAKKQTSDFTDSLSTGLGAIPGPIGNAARTFGRLNSSIRTATVSTRGFGMALAATGIGAIVVALGALFAAFRSTQEGADRLNRVLEPLRAVMAVLWGVVQDLSLALADGLVKAIKDPSEAFKSLGETIVNQVLNRFKAIIDGAGAIGRGLRALAERDFAGAREAASDFGDAYLQALTGVEDVVDKARSGIMVLNDEFQRGIDIGNRLADLTIEIEELQNEQILSLAGLRREREELLNLSRNQTVSDEERLSAGQQALEILRQETDEQRRLLDLQIEEAELKASQNDTDRQAQGDLNRLIAQRDELEANYQRQARRTESIVNQIIQSQVDGERKIAETRQELAEEFRGLLLSEEEQIIASYEERIALLTELKEAEAVTEEEFTEILAAIHEERNERLRELNEEDAEETNEARIGSIREVEEQISELQQEFREAGTDAEREALREKIAMMQEELEARKTTAAEQEAIEKAKAKAIFNANVQALAGILTNLQGAFGKSKALALAEATINSYQAFTNALANTPGPPPIPQIAAGAALASGLAQVASMRSTNVEGFGTGGIVGSRVSRRNGDNRLITARTGEAILTEGQQRSIGFENLAAAGVPGFSGSLDTSGFEQQVDRMGGMLDNIRVQVDLAETTRKINDRNRDLGEREVSTI